MADLIITSFRLSFIWTETLTNPLSEQNWTVPDYQFLASNSGYISKIGSITGHAESLSLSLPWKEKRNNRFWRSYLPGAALPSVSGKQAWKYLVPMRWELRTPFKTANGESIQQECFLYPHGFGCVVNIKCVGEFSLAGVAEYATSLNRETFTHESRVPSTLRDIADQEFNWMRALVHGKSDPQGALSGPFSVVSLIKGKVTGEGAYRVQSGELQQVMEALTTWPVDWKIPVGPGLSSASMPLSSKAGAGAIVYVRGSGILIWIPEKLLSDKAGLSSIACYHQNQVFGGMQVESLGSLIGAAARDFRAGKRVSDLSIMLKACVRNAIDRLADLYQGDKRITYRSAALQRQIASTYLADLNEVRRQFLPGIEDLK